MKETFPTGDQDAAILEAKKRVDKIKKFYKSLASWAGTSVFMIAIDLFTTHRITWSIFPVFFWGIAIASQFFRVLPLLRMDKEWEDRMLRRQLGQTALPDPDQVDGEDYSEELLRGPNDKVKEKADLTEFRKLKRPWKDEDLV